MSTVAIVPARSGSKRLPGKNMLPLGGRPLVHWTLDACLEAEGIDQVIFSTDSEDYWKSAVDTFGEERLRLDSRSAEQAGDKVKIYDYLKNNAAQIFEPVDETFVLCLPTVPFRTGAHIDAALAESERLGRPIFGATEYGYPLSFGFYIKEDGGWEPVIEPSPLFTGNTRSQDQQTAYRPNGALYVRSVADLNSDQPTLFVDASPFLMDQMSSIDIDNEHDFKLAEAMLATGL